VDDRTRLRGSRSGPEGLTGLVEERLETGELPAGDEIPILLAVSDNGPPMTAADTRSFVALCSIAQHFGRPGVSTDEHEGRADAIGQSRRDGLMRANKSPPSRPTTHAQPTARRPLMRRSESTAMCRAESETPQAVPPVDEFGGVE
jgi:transposase InsO family protein